MRRQLSLRANHAAIRATIPLYRAAEAAGLHCERAINVRLSPGHITIPDLTIGSRRFTEVTADVADVLLVGEFLSPADDADEYAHRLLRYADAGIP
jgi:hypothetical protein